MNFKANQFRTFTLATMLIVAAQLSAQQRYTIQGNLGKDKQGKVLLVYNDANDKPIKDSAEVKNGVFQLSGTIAEPAHATLELNPTGLGLGPDSDIQDFFLDPGKTTVISTAGMINATITGGASQVDFTMIMKEYKVLADKGKRLDTLYQKYSADGNDDGLKSIRTEGQQLKAKRVEIQNAFVKEHPESFVAFSLWLRRANSGVIDVPVVEPGFNAFGEKIRNSPTGKKVAKRIAIAKSLEPGNPAIDFTLPDTSGKMVSLSSFKGKNVLLCFWFRNFVPFETFSFVMTKMNKQAKANNLAIVSVYYNIDNTDWQTILHENGMTWTNLIDRDGIVGNLPVSQVAKAYDLNISGIPQWILIGPDGKVVARNINLAGDPVADVNKLLGR
ncbi:DUF4369 domain-containing protein [Chitinophagaceae bacterium 26-R-25]|nr:DUF4369 domain-containing protein [Chitinophagaceae bacterium 26-R-25]